MVSIARAIIEPRRLLLIDEPTKGLAPAIVGGLIDCLKEIKRDRRDDADGRAEFPRRARGRRLVRVMDNGRIVHAGAMAEFAEDAALQSRLLGLSLDWHQ